MNNSQTKKLSIDITVEEDDSIPSDEGAARINKPLHLRKQKSKLMTDKGNLLSTIHPRLYSSSLSNESKGEDELVHEQVQSNIKNVEKTLDMDYFNENISMVKTLKSTFIKNNRDIDSTLILANVHLVTSTNEHK